MSVHPVVSAQDAWPLNPYQARAKLLLTVWLLAEIGGATRPAPGLSTAPRPRAPGQVAVHRPARRRMPVRPPRAC